MEPTGGWTLVTGGSGGIGFELARCFAGDGSDLVLVAQDPGRLEEASRRLEAEFGVRVRTLACDLSRPEAPRRIQEELSAAGVRVRALVNNAGFTMYGPFHRSDPAAQRALVEVNAAALTELTGRFLPPMVEAGEGAVLNVASTAGFLPGPLMASYYASKAYVISFTEALAVELEGTGVRVSALCPGATRSRFQERGRLEGSRLLRLQPLDDPAWVAAAGYRGLLRGRTLVLPRLRDRLVPATARLTPWRLQARLVRAAQAPVAG